MSDYEERLHDVELDIGYALGELKDLQDQVADSALVERLEGIDSRLREIQDALDHLTREPGQPFTGAAHARDILGLE